MDKQDWREVVRQLRPELTDEQFESAWDEFLTYRVSMLEWRQLKRMYQARKVLYADRLECDREERGGED